VAGLRREEIAQLAGVSVDYYIRLEQGRAERPSESVMRAVARALQLTLDEEEHLMQLIRSPKPVPSQEQVRPEVHALLRSLGLPAFVLNGRMDLLAWNPSAQALILDCASTPTTRDNVAHMIFLDPVAREYYLDWDDVAREAAGYLRLGVSRQPAVSALVHELSAASHEFRAIWKDHEIRQKSHGTKRIRHPRIGTLTLSYETLALPADADQTLVTYNVEPGSPSEKALRLLG